MIEHVGRVRVRLLLEFFGDTSKILNASRHRLPHVRSIGAETSAAL